MTPIETVNAFIAALEAKDTAKILSLVDDAIVYENVSLPPARGRKAFEKQMRAFERYFDGFHVEMHAIAANGNTVLTERVDVLEAGGLKIAPWVCGTFEVRDGKIVLWRDYFDWGRMTMEIVRAIPRRIARALGAR